MRLPINILLVCTTQKLVHAGGIMALECSAAHTSTQIDVMTDPLNLKSDHQ